MARKTFLMLTVNVIGLIMPTLAQQNSLDSLWNLYNSAEKDTTRIRLLLDIGYACENSSVDSAMYIYQKAIELCDSALQISAKGLTKQNKNNEQVLDLKASVLKSIGILNYYTGNYEEALSSYFKSLDISVSLQNKKRIAACYNNIGLIYSEKGDFFKALEYHSNSLELKKELGDKRGQAYSYNNIGTEYRELGIYEKALENFYKSLKLKEETGDSAGVAGCFSNIGGIYFLQKNFQKAIEFYFKALKIDEISGNRRGMAADYSNIGGGYNELGNFDLAIEYNIKGLRIDKELNDQPGISKAYSNIADVYSNIGLYDTACKFYRKSLEIKEAISDKRGMVITYHNMALLKKRVADSLKYDNRVWDTSLREALGHAQRSYDLAKEIHALPYQYSAASMLQGIYTLRGDYKMALKYAEIHISTRDSLFSEEKTRSLTEMSVKYETEKKEQQIALQKADLEKKELEVRQKRTQRNAFIGGFSLLSVLAFVILIGYTQKQKANKLLTAQRAEIMEKNTKLEDANREIAEKNKNILDSIRYAKRIQEAILPPERIIRKNIEESFVLYKPRDIVSGDFYWMEAVREKILFAAADCTGHGVPGALVSIVGHNGLNRVVREQGITKPSAILDLLNIFMKEALGSNEENDLNDGMDIALCSLDITSGTLEFAGANNPLYLARNGEMIIYHPDKQPIGKFEHENKFTNHIVTLQPDDTVYIFTDGYVDQFGGEDDKRFTLKRFRELLLEITNQPMRQQKKLLAEKFDHWMNSSQQIDDVLVIGIRIIQDS